MILAAGFGTRLLPHTLLRPKPLFPILNQSLLLLTIKRLQNAGCDHIVVNCHHLRHQIAAALQGMPGVAVLEEEIILGTGGGLRGALPLLRDEPLLISNGDIYHTVDFALLFARHLAGGAAVSLAVHDYPRFNTVRVNDDRIAGFSEKVGPDCLAFTGLHVIDPAILQDITPSRYSSILDLYRQVLAFRREIAALRVDGSYWTDMGTPEDYLALHAGLLKGTIPSWPEMDLPAAGPFLISPKARLADDLQLEDWCCLGDVEVGGDVRISRTVAWDNVHIAAGSMVDNALLSA
jgi:mannose-1-phosphate guanylyltransferase